MGYLTCFSDESIAKWMLGEVYLPEHFPKSLVNIHNEGQKSAIAQTKIIRMTNPCSIIP